MTLQIILTILLGIPVSGFVTDSSTGKGIEGVVVSDGYHCTSTDDSGKYFLMADSLARTISVSIPASHEIALDTDGAPAFFKYIDSGDTDFSLKPRKKVSDRFTLIALSDAHIRDSLNVERFRSESLPDIRRTISRYAPGGPVIGIGLGDQLWDVMDKWTVIKEGFTGLKSCGGQTVPFFYCIGNHDHESGAGDTDYAVTEHFVRHFGPTDYSFDIGKVHFVVMDDIQHTGTQRDGIKISYTTGLNDAQMQWLREDLSLVEDKEHKAVVFCVHAPLSGRFSHKDDVKPLLEEFAEAHILSGHEHNINNMWPSKKIWEHNIQSLCGAWWYSNLSPSGCPLGYSVLTFEGSSLAEEYNKATTENRDFQMRVYSGNDSYGPDTPGYEGEPERTNVYSWPEELKGHFVVRVWDGTREWDVKLVCGGKEYPMKQTDVKFFDAATAAYMVDVFGAPYGGSGIYKAKVDAFWTVPAPCGDPAMEKKWEVVAVHKMPSGKRITYRSKVLLRDFTGFATGTHYPR